MTITSVTALLGIIAVAFLLLLLVKVIKQPVADNTAKQLLILLLIGLLSMAFCYFYIYARLAASWPRLANIEIGLSYWIGPSLYFYIRRINGGHNPFANRLNLLHWAPAILIELLLLPFFVMPLSEKIGYLESPSGPYGRGMWFVWWGFHVQLLIYIFFCQPLLRTYQQRIEHNYSAISIINLRWLQLVCYGFVVEILVERLLPRLHITSSGLSDTAAMAIYIFVIAVTYAALGQSWLQFVSDWQPAPSHGKYSRSGLRDESQQYFFMEREIPR